MDATRLVGLDVPEEGHHCADQGTFEFERWVKSDHLMDIMFQLYAASGKVGLDQRRLGGSCGMPDVKRNRDL
jgi:hypothetical protein